jgi:hypothetical protein
MVKGSATGFSIFVLKRSQELLAGSLRVVSARAFPGVALQNQDASNHLQKPDYAMPVVIA